MCCVVTVFTLYRILNQTSRSAALPYPEYGCRRMPAPMRSPCIFYYYCSSSYALRQYSVDAVSMYKSPIMKKLTHIVYYKYQQRSLQRWVLTRNSSNSRLTSLKYFYKIQYSSIKQCGIYDLLPTIFPFPFPTSSHFLQLHFPTSICSFQVLVYPDPHQHSHPRPLAAVLRLFLPSPRGLAVPQS